MKKILCLFLSLIILLCACQKQIPYQSQSAYPVEQTTFLLNTVVTITIYDAQTQKEPSELLEESFRLCRNYEEKLSRTIEGSEVDKMNHANGSPVEVSSETAHLLELALTYSQLSNGSFDVTIAPVSMLWDFQNKNSVPPSPEEIEEKGVHVGYENLSVQGTSVVLSDPEGAIDLGAIAKGFIVDKVAEYLKGNGVTSAILNFGGNVLVIGAKPDGTNFNVGVQRPFETYSDILGAVSVKDKSVVTSGIYERFFQYKEKLYHHILNPKTGYPVENNLLCVTIISDTSTQADGLSTACFVLGLEEGMKLIESIETAEAIFVTKEGELHCSSGIGETIPFKTKP